MFASLQRKPRSGPQTVCHSKPIKDSNAVFFVVLQDFCHAPRSSRVRPVWRNKPNVCFYETNRVVEFSSMSRPGQNECCEALNEQNERVLRGYTQALSWSFPCFAELA